MGVSSLISHIAGKKHQKPQESNKVTIKTCSVSTNLLILRVVVKALSLSHLELHHLMTI